MTEPTPKCFKKNYTEIEAIDKNLRIGFCLNGYSASYNPTANITGNGKEKETFSFGQGLLAGACAKIFVGEEMNCSMKFGPPPSEFSIYDNVDFTAPDLTTYCTEEITDDLQKIVPDWLLQKCSDAFFPKPPAVVKKPENIAVFTGAEDVKINCQVENFLDMDYQNWVHFEAVGVNPKYVSVLTLVFPEYTNLYSVEDTYNLIVKKADERTSGIYQCATFIADEQLEQNFFSFLLTMGKIFIFNRMISMIYVLFSDENPLCIQKSYPDIPDDRIFAFCLTNYTGVYPPELKILASSIYEKSLGTNGNVAGACALIGKNDQFDCSAAFGKPPKVITDLENFDTSAPDLSTSCSSNDGLLDSSYVPKWLEDQCLVNWGEPEITNRSVNTAVFTGESAVLDCTTKGFAEYGTALWAYAPLGNLEEIAIISTNDVVTPNLRDKFSIEGRWNIRVDEVNSQTAGLFECFATVNNFSKIMDAFLMEMSNYSK